MWGNLNLLAFMAVTAHYILQCSDGNLLLRSRLIAFRNIIGLHNGENLVKYFITILQECGIIKKVGAITLDNASNCNRMVRELEDKLHKEHSVHFNAEDKRLRCVALAKTFAMIVDLALQVLRPHYQYCCTGWRQCTIRYECASPE